MTELIIKLFIKDSKNTENPAVRAKYGKIAGYTGIFSNVLLCVLKGAVGIIFSSIAVLADAVNNLLDAASSLITIVGFHLSEKPADEKHPFGHARIEYITGLIVSFIIAVLGIQLGRESIQKIITPQESEFSAAIIVVLLFSILIKLWQSLFYKKMGRAIKSPTLEAVSADSGSDVISTSAVLAGVVITKLTGFNLDGYMGLAVAVLITVSGIKLLLSTSNPLLGEAPEKELKDKIRALISSYDGILGVHDLVIHSYGAGQSFASVHCEVDSREDILVSHDLIDNIERDISKKLNIHFTIHMDPIVVGDEYTNEIKEQVKEVIREKLGDFASLHDFRMVVGPTHTNLIFDVALPYSTAVSDDEAKRIIDENVAQIDKKFRTVVNIDREI